MAVSILGNGYVPTGGTRDFEPIGGGGGGGITISSGDVSTYVMTFTGNGDEIKGNSGITWDETTLNVAGDIESTGGIKSGGPISTTDDVTFDGNLSVALDTDVSGNVGIGGNLDVIGIVSVTNDFQATGNASIGASTLIGGDLEVTDAIVTFDNLSIGGNDPTSIFNMHHSVSGYPWTWTAAGDTSIKLEHYLDDFITCLGTGAKTTTLHQPVSISQTATIIGDTSIGGVLTIGGSAATSRLNMGSSVNPAYPWYWTNTNNASLLLEQYGNDYIKFATTGTGIILYRSTSINNTLAVTGAVTMSGAATVGTTLGVSGNVTMSTAATVGTTLDIGGTTTIGGGASTSIFKMGSNYDAYPWTWTNTNNTTLLLEQHSDDQILFNKTTGITIYRPTVIENSLEVTGNLILDTVQYTTIATHVPPASARYVNVTVPSGTGTIYVDLDNIEDAGYYATLFLTYKLTSTGAIAITVRNKADGTVHSASTSSSVVDDGIMLLWDDTNGIWYKQVLT